MTEPLDPIDGSLDDLTEADLAEQADANRPYGAVTAEDLSPSDLIDDGADLATQIGEDDPDLEGVIPLDHQIELERDQVETIDDRIRQEAPDPTSAITPPDRV